MLQIYQSELFCIAFFDQFHNFDIDFPRLIRIMDIILHYLGMIYSEEMSVPHIFIRAISHLEVHLGLYCKTNLQCTS